MKRNVTDAAPAPIAENRVKYETPWTCWPVVGGCGHVFGLNFPGGPCTQCGEFAVTRVLTVRPAVQEAR